LPYPQILGLARKAEINWFHRAECKLRRKSIGQSFWAESRLLAKRFFFGQNPKKLIENDEKMGELKKFEQKISTKKTSE
jgi:hypothetical protein